jgi:hypothetical protein
MKRIILLALVTSFAFTTHSQKKQQQPVTGYAITALEKGGRNWKEVKLVNITTGEEVKSIYQSTQEVQALNARTKNPVVKKEINATTAVFSTTQQRKKVVNLDEELNKAQGSNGNGNVNLTRVMFAGPKVQTDKPFATNSAAIAYDKKHERLYYTPMGINQLRYIDLRSNKIYYFEDEAFGQVKGFGDAPDQITRMVIASDGDGYALTNDGNHLIRFTTGKKQTITDLGSLGDDAKNGNFSVHNPGGYGGDMIADVSGNLYLVTANRNVFKIPIETKLAAYLGTIKGLPRGFSTNGAMVEEGSKVIVASSESTVGYYRFDLTTMQAEKVSGQTDVFNASDLANGNLAFAKKKKDRKNEEPAQEAPKEPITDVAKRPLPQDAFGNNGITLYPNPVTDRVVKVSFANQPAGKYQVQFMDLSGKLISTQEVIIINKIQVADISLPEVAKGSYLIKVASETNRVSVTNKLIVQ